MNALPVIPCVMTRLALNLFDALRVWNLIRIESLVALDATQRPMHRPFEFCSINEKGDGPASPLHRQSPITVARKTLLRCLSECSYGENEKREREEDDLLKLGHAILRAVAPRPSYISLSFNKAFQFAGVLFFIKENLFK
jgi:hypothetical protein